MTTQNFVNYFAIGAAIAIPVAILAYLGTKECPHCKERIDKRATACKHCGHDIEVTQTLDKPEGDDEYNRRFNR